MWRDTCELFGWPQTFMTVLQRLLLRGSCPCFHPRVDLWPHRVDSQDVLLWWVLGCLPVGFLLLVGGARAAGAALAGSSICSFLAYALKRTYGGENLETLVHGAVILGSVGLIGFGLAGLALGTHAPLGRFPMALVPAISTAAVGTLIVIKIHAGAALPCSPRSCFRGFEEPWVQGLLAFNVVFLALLFLVPAWRASSRSSGEHEEDDPFADWLIGRSGDGGTPF